MVDVNKFMFRFSSPKILDITQQQKDSKGVVYHITKNGFKLNYQTLTLERGKRLIVYVNLSITLLSSGTLASNWQ